jgi:hypothetical protein
LNLPVPPPGWRCVCCRQQALADQRYWWFGCSPSWVPTPPRTASDIADHLLRDQAASALALVWLPANNSTTPAVGVLVAQLAMTYPLRVVLPLATSTQPSTSSTAATAQIAGAGAQLRRLPAVRRADLTLRAQRGGCRDRLAQPTCWPPRPARRHARDGGACASPANCTTWPTQALPLRLNLRTRTAAPSPQLQLVEQLSAELMGDIRGVVQRCAMPVARHRHHPARAGRAVSRPALQL